MLQQTRVEVVVPYFQAFLERFQTVEDLASAPVEDVLALWSGLGYYRRARQLHRAARQIVESGSGFPPDSKGLLELPGVGPYTAAAVASIAFGECVPVLDGNVERVLCRRQGIEEDPKKSSVRATLRQTAATLLDASRPGDSNQALMEIGATVCRSRRPDCGSCPLRPGCVAAERGDPERYPRPRRRRRVQRIELVVAVVRESGRTLLFRRPEESELLAGIWELPNVPHGSRRPAMERHLARRYGGRWHLGGAAGRVRHGITYRAIIVHVHPARFEAGDQVGEGPEAAWVGPEERSRFPVSSMVEKVLAVEGG